MVFVQPTCTKQFRRDLEPCTHRCTHVPGVSCKVFSFAVDFISYCSNRVWLSIMRVQPMVTVC